jgi:hypothetical protein
MTGASSAAPNPEAVEELLGVAQRFMADERTRGQALETKTSTLAGFSGAILALTSTLGAALFDRDLGTLAPAVQILFGLGVAALAAAAILAVGSVLVPQAHLGVSMDEIEHFPEYPLIATNKIEIQGQLLVTTVNALAREREINDRKASRTTYAARALVAGYVAVAAMAMLVALT